MVVITTWGLTSVLFIIQKVWIAVTPIWHEHGNGTTKMTLKHWKHTKNPYILLELLSTQEIVPMDFFYSKVCTCILSRVIGPLFMERRVAVEFVKCNFSIWSSQTKFHSLPLYWGGSSKLQRHISLQEIILDKTKVFKDVQDRCLQVKQKHKRDQNMHTHSTVHEI